MNCEDCGTELPKGGYYCSCCGRPAGFDANAPAPTVVEPGLDEVPEPATSCETPAGPAVAVESNYRTRIQGKGLCAMCMGAFPDTVLSAVDGKPYCPDCSPMVGQRREPEVEDSAVPAPGAETAGGVGAVEPLMFHESRPSGGPKGVFAAIVLVLLAGAGFVAYTMLGGDRIDKLMSGLDTTRGDAFLLAQTYILGENFSYVAKGAVKAEGEVSGGFFGNSGGDIDLSMELLGGVSINVLKVDDQGNADLSVTTDSIDLDVDFKLAGQSFPVKQQMMAPLNEIRGKTLVLRVDPFGNPLEGSQPGSDGMQQMMSGQIGEMPKHALKVGDTWTARMPLSGAPGMGMPSGMTMGNLAFGVTYEVEGFKRMAGRDCMVISVKGEMDGEDSLKMPFFNDVHFDMGLKGVMFYDVTVRRLVKLAMDVHLDMGLAGAMGGVEVDLEMELDIDLR